MHKSLKKSFKKNALIPSHSMGRTFDKYSRHTFFMNHWLHHSCPLIPMNRIILHTATQIYSETRFQGICLLSVDDAVSLFEETLSDLMLSVFLFILKPYM